MPSILTVSDKIENMKRDLSISILRANGRECVSGRQCHARRFVFFAGKKVVPDNIYCVVAVAKRGE